jgi:hypothetical protein
MNILAELKILLTELGLTEETGIFSTDTPAEYCIVTPLYDDFGYFADNRPHYDVQEVRISLFRKTDYLARKNELIKALIAGDYAITGRNFAGYDNQTGYYNYAIDVQKYYNLED